MTKAARTILVIAIAAPLVGGGLFIGGRVVVRSVAQHQQQVAQERAERKAQDAVEREAALKERRRAAAMNIPLTTLGEPAPKTAPGDRGVPRPAAGKIEIVQLGEERRPAALPSPVPNSTPLKPATPPTFAVAPITIAPKPSRIEVASAQPSPRAPAPSSIAPVTIAPRTPQIDGTAVDRAAIEGAPKPASPAIVAPLKADVATGPSPAPLQLRDDPKPKLQPTAAASSTAGGELMQSPATITSSPASGAIRLGTVDGLKKELPPPLEEQRRAQEAQAVADIKIVSGFECSAPLSVVRKSATHYAVKFEGTRGSLDNYFLFQVQGAKGKTIRIDFEDAPIGKWWSLNPVYSYVTDLSDPANFTSEPVAEPAKPVAAHNGPLLPDTRGEKWHFMPNVWTEEGGWTGEPGNLKTPSGRLCMVHTFNEDSAYVALKVPYTPSMNERMMKRLGGNPLAKVIEIGRTPQGRSLQLVKIGGDDEADKTRPCVLLYAREHGTEQDSSWVVEGCGRFLTGTHPDAVRLRRQFTFLLLPVMDPDGAATSFYDRIPHSFTSEDPSPEALAFSTWFEQWVDAGNRLDVALDFHNVESAEAEHLFCMYGDPGRIEDCRLLHDALLKRFSSTDPIVVRKGVSTGYITDRLAGWLGYSFGPISMLYEANSQEKGRHLSLGELRNIGQLTALSVTDFLDSTDGLRAMAFIDRASKLRVERISSVGRGTNVFETRVRVRSPVWDLLHLPNDKGSRGSEAFRE